MLFLVMIIRLECDFIGNLGESFGVSEGFVI